MTEDERELLEQKNYELGIIAGMVLCINHLEDQAGEFFIKHKDDVATLFRTEANHLAILKNDKRNEYDKKYPKH